MRYTILDEEIPASKDYRYTQEQLEYIAGEFNTNANRFVFLEHSTGFDNTLERVVGKLKDVRIEDGSITAELVILETPMGNIVKVLQEHEVKLLITIVGYGHVVDGIVQDYELSHASMYAEHRAKNDDIMLS